MQSRPAAFNLRAGAVGTSVVFVVTSTCSAHFLAVRISMERASNDFDHGCPEGTTRPKNLFCARDTLSCKRRCSFGFSIIIRARIHVSSDLDHGCPLGTT